MLSIMHVLVIGFERKILPCGKFVEAYFFRIQWARRELFRTYNVMVCDATEYGSKYEKVIKKFLE